MAMIAAKCTNCGANIQVDETKEAGICESCGTAFITEKAINNYIVNNTYNIDNANIVLPQKNINNLINLGNEEYRNRRYTNADKYYREVLEIDNSNYECNFKRFLCLAQEKNDQYHNSYMNEMVEKLQGYLQKTNSNEALTKEQKEEYIGFACDECLSIVMKDYCLGRDECLVSGKLKKPDGIYTISTVCGNTYIGLFELLDVMESYLTKYDSVEKNWKMYCMYIETVMETCCKKYQCVTDNQCYGKSASGAEHVYEAGKKLKKYAIKVNPTYNLPSTLVSPKEGGTGCEVSNGCYVATCVYGSYDCPQVWTLRRFRDNTLAETMLGRAFIRTYYAISPTLVRWFGDTSWFKKMWKGTLDRMVSKLQSNGVEDTPYQDRNWR